MAASSQQNNGRNQRLLKEIAARRSPNFKHFYKNTLPDVHPGEFAFHLDLMYPKRKPVSLDRMVEDLSWDDEEATLTGSLTLRKPDPHDPLSTAIVHGQVIRCRVHWGDQKHLYELWTMRVDQPQIQVDQATVTLTLKDDMARLEQVKDDWVFRTTKHRHHGYYLHEIVQEVAHKVKIKLGPVMKGTIRQTFTLRKATPLAAIRKAALAEKNATGRSMVMRWRNGKLELVPLTYNPVLYVLSKEIQTALVTQRTGGKPVTLLRGTGHIGKGKHAKKVHFDATDRDLVKAYGRVRKVKDYGQVKSLKDLRDQVKRDFADGLRLTDTVSIEVAGLPFILRGDAAQILLPVEGYRGNQSFMFATRASHTVQAGTFTSSFDFKVRDQVLFQQKADARAKVQRAINRAKRLADAKNNAASDNQSAPGTGSRFLVTASLESLGGEGACGYGIAADGYSELSTDPHQPLSGLDFAALGNIPCGTQLRITNPANGSSVVAHKQDKGAGSDFLPVMGLYPGTVAKLGLSGGQFSVIIERVDGGALSPVRGSPA